MTADRDLTHGMTNDICGDPAALAGYLYGEGDATERAAIEAHLAACVSCAAELAALGATRSALASWAPPDVELGFRVTSSRDPDTVVRPARWWQRPLPAWAQAAAAAVIFATGLALGTRGVPEPDRERASAGAAASAPASTPAAAVTPDDIARLEERLRAQIEAARVPAAPAPVQASSSADAEALLPQIRRLLAESEARQERELAMRLSQVLQEVESQRRVDLAMIERTFGQMEGVTRPELAEQRQMLNYLIRTAAQQRPQR
jgi:anti-sigma factor RsiW